MWAGGAWGPSLAIEINEGPAGTVIVQASGDIAASAVLGPEGSLAAPPLPSVLHGEPAAFEVLGVDAEPFALELRESWRFQGRHAGSGSPSLKRTTPFWDARSFASWTGPLFSRETTVRWIGRHLSAAAATEPERFSAQLGDIFGEVKRPSPPAPSGP